jgi:hypothetical protein
MIAGRLDRISHVARHQPQTEGHRERLTQPHVAQVDGAGAASVFEFVRVKLLHLSRREFL